MALTLPVDNLLLKRESVAVNKTKSFLPIHQRDSYLFTCRKRSEDLGLKQIPTALEGRAIQWDSFRRSRLPRVN